MARFWKMRGRRADARRFLAFAIRSATGCLRRNHRLASVGTRGRFQSESAAEFIGIRIGVQLVVKIVERYLADYRDIFADPDSRKDLLDCLDAFVRVGWPEARALTYRIADIWR